MLFLVLEVLGWGGPPPPWARAWGGGGGGGVGGLGVLAGPLFVIICFWSQNEKYVASYPSTGKFLVKCWSHMLHFGAKFIKL